MPFKSVEQNINFAKEEEKTLAFWQDNRIFEKSNEVRDASKRFGFYDGPPFATGLPHYGHLLAGIIKDIIPRYWNMKGYHVERRFGWDCHGLPIEYEIDKTLGISGAAGVKEFGIAKYNDECRSIVLRYTSEWEKTVNRIGRWVDFKNDYKTMDVNFMESVWWVFKQLWDKGLVYKGYRVMPYSTAVATPLSNFEASSNYKEVQDPAVTVRFKIKDQDNTSFLAWTTTPWTLPSNLALAVHPELNYVKIKVLETGEFLILGESRLKSYFKKEDAYEVIETYKGADLKDTHYEPLFPYFAERAQSGAFRVLVDDYVTDADGSGIVHQAPAFGEDDFRVCKDNGIEIVLPVDEDGRFTNEVPDFEGRAVKEADKDIIARLKNEGQLFRHDTISHNYPFCWRSDTPLIYRAVSSWFVSVEKIKEQMIKSNADTHWVPEHLRDGRFGNWLENARDWNISRNRFWGNPLPIWENKETGEYLCFGSKKELEEATGKSFDDLHREHLDDVAIADPNGKGEFKRVPEVLDCWFESGSMPYAQAHYPFENKEQFEQSFPADFIAEGLDQTRGWFYTLTVLGTALFGQSPFKNVVVNGMVLAEDGKKMSKRLKNYPDPTEILDEYGADALRLFMIQSAAVRAEELRFSEAGVKDIVRRILLKWWNSYSFFNSYVTIDQWEPAHTKPPVSKNVLDQWILSRLQSLLKQTEKEMALYHLYNVVPALLDFIEDLTNVYIRLNRKRFWAEGENTDKEAAYGTLYYVLYTMCQVMAPFTPFLAEQMFQNLKLGFGKESVHLEDFPVASEEFIRNDLEESVAIMNRVVLMARNLREKQNIKVKIPLKKISIIHRDDAMLSHVKILESYIKEELNVREVLYQTNEDEFVELTAKANGAALGKRLGKKFGPVNKAVQNLAHEQIVALEKGEMITVEGETLGAGDVLVYRNAKKGHDGVVSDAIITIDLDTSLEQDQLLEGMAREVVNRVQKLRKTADLKLDDRIQVQCLAEGELKDAVEAHLDYIKDQVLATEFVLSEAPQGAHSEECEVEKKKLVVALSVE
ncbi:MAG: isoleucine--tRNA ligase [Deltaproteobacteria bacterium]|nr:isoleucine--tRNA ligase [Deltaproteobacteria bacterium]